MTGTYQSLQGVDAKVGDKISVTQVFEFGVKHYFWDDDDAQARSLEFADEIVHQMIEHGIAAAPVYSECNGEILEVWGVNHEYEVTAVVRVVGIFDLKPPAGLDVTKEELDQMQQAGFLTWPLVLKLVTLALGLGLGAAFVGYAVSQPTVAIQRAFGDDAADTVKTVGVVIAIVALVFLLSKVL